MKVGYLLIGNPPFYPTGYGTQLKFIGDLLIDSGKTVGHIADFGFAACRLDWEGRALSPCDQLPGPLSQEPISRHLKHFRMENGLDEVVIITLGDAYKWGGLIKHP